jgi:hypothetical protein
VPAATIRRARRGRKGSAGGRGLSVEGAQANWGVTRSPAPPSAASDNGPMHDISDDPHFGRRVQSDRAVRLMEVFGLTEEELCATLDVDPLALLSGQLDQNSELPILLALTNDATERAGAAMLRRWVRASGPSGRPIEMLVGRDFGAFEDALTEFAERGFVLRGGSAGRG